MYYILLNYIVENNQNETRKVSIVGVNFAVQSRKPLFDSLISQNCTYLSFMIKHKEMLYIECMYI